MKRHAVRLLRRCADEHGERSILAEHLHAWIAELEHEYGPEVERGRSQPSRVLLVLEHLGMCAAAYLILAVLDPLRDRARAALEPVRDELELYRPRRIGPLMILAYAMMIACTLALPKPSSAESTARCGAPSERWTAARYPSDVYRDHNCRLKSADPR